MKKLSQSLSEHVFGRFVVILLTLGFLALIGAAGAAGWVQSRNQEHIGWITHTHDVERALAEFGILSERTEAARRGYLIEGDRRFRRTYRESWRRLPGILDRIAGLTVDNERQQIRVRALRMLLERQRILQKRSIDLADSGAAAGALTSFRTDTSADLTRSIRAVSQQMVDEEARLLARRSQVQRDSVRTFYMILVGTGLLLLLVAASAITIILRYTRDLTASRDALRGLNENLESRVAERTTDLRRANDEIQRFAYIVSHDLRAPLVNVMGFTAELDSARKPIADLIDRAEAENPAIVTPEARAAAREDLPEAIGFIRTSTQKMDRLINSILKLSREGRRTITPEPIDVDAMVAGIADSLQHRLEALGAEIRVATPLPEIVSDRLSLEQILSNLVENAVKYLKPGRAGVIAVRGGKQGDRLIFEVEDNGRGVDPKDHERIFDLFRRSGVQDQPGEGIGLAHVRALAYRLGGLVSCESELDRGATFRLSLPAEYQAEQG